MIYRVPNPACGGVLPVELITDRAKRYRANSEQCRPTGPRVCACGSTKNLGVGHLDGNEDNGDRSNLAWQCKSCNAKQAHADKKAGKGKRTRQFNPRRPKVNTRGKKAKPPADSIPNLAAYSIAVSQHRRGAHDEGGRIIHATPPHIRRQYAREIAARKAERGTNTRVPF